MKTGHSSERLGSNSPTRLLLVRPNCRKAQLYQHPQVPKRSATRNCGSSTDVPRLGHRKALEERCPEKVDWFITR